MTGNLLYSSPMTQATALEILQTGANVFLTGEPGSGKTYLVNQYVQYLREHQVAVAITASTGIAATHIAGSTIHSWSGIGIRRSLTKHDLEALTTMERLVKQITNTRVLIIDEISMLDAGLLDMVEEVCRVIRRDEAPFGGLQVVVVGDFFQLPPISKFGEPDAQFAFSARAWTEAMFEVCYLTEQHRQSDAALSGVLGAIRRGEAPAETHELLKTRQVTAGPAHAETTKLYAHNANVDEVNAERLATLPGDVHQFTMSHRGPKAKVEQLVRGCLSPEVLELKIGAVVMCTRNNPERGYANGTLGTVVQFSAAEGYPVIKTRTGRTMTVEPMEWAIEDGEHVTASIEQVPLRLAWAITVHKSQGMSLDAAVMDLSRSFAFGQGYVALSRVRTLEGLHLLGWNERALQVDPQIQEQDRTMRAASVAAEEAWRALPTSMKQERQEDFLRQSGGKIHVKPSTVVPGAVVDVPPHTKRLAEIREQYPRAYTPWTAEQDTRLLELHQANATMKSIAADLQRHPGGIRARLKKQGLM